MSNNIQEENVLHRPHIIKQFEKFIKSKSTEGLYDGVTPGNNEILIRIFSYAPPKDRRPSGSIILPNNSGIAGASRHKVQKYFVNDIVMPYAKVIKVGPSEEAHPYKEGDIVLLPSSKVSEVVDNPKYIHWLQAQDVGMATPKGTAPKPKIPAVELHYGHYQFTRIGNLYADDDDLLTYMLPTFEVKRYEYRK